MIVIAALVIALGVTMAIVFSIMLASAMDLINAIWIFIGIADCVFGVAGLFLALGKEKLDS